MKIPLSYFSPVIISSIYFPFYIQEVKSPITEIQCNNLSSNSAIDIFIIAQVSFTWLRQDEV